MRRLLVVLAAAALLAALGGTALAHSRGITVDDNFFVREGAPPTVTVRRGDVVAFRFRGDSPHNVTVTRGPVRFRSTTRLTGTYRRKMTTRGRYTIVCTIHGPEQQRMTLRVR